VEPHLVHAATGREYLGEIELVERKPIATFDLVEPGT
jgi:hypothetical protein